MKILLNRSEHQKLLWVFLATVLFSAYPTTSFSDETTVPNIVPLTLPSNGIMRKHTSRESIAPFTINTSAGTGGNYFVKLESMDDGRDVVSVFVRGGSSVSVKVPLGSYVMKYAVGSVWYGEKNLFGIDTDYYRAEDVFDFTKFDMGDHYQIGGNEVTLYNVIDGNLHTEEILANQF